MALPLCVALRISHPRSNRMGYGRAQRLPGGYFQNRHQGRRDG
jgi:hypothetical protein